jgi:hypothetical protein
MNFNPFHPGCVILDACCLLNIYASRRMVDILPCIGSRTVVVDYVLNRETQYVRDIVGKIPVDVTPVIAAGMLGVVSMETVEEQASYIDLVAAIGDDGESMTGAMAIQNKWAMATDDRAATQVMKQMAPQVELVTTPDIIYSWADTTHPSEDELRSVITDIRRRASFSCQRGHPYYGWWCQYEQ